ncbi:hypothetical protein M426DRAFT_219698 [Hypoxylon sp. CI-4A]|nr:hypothetical protein M426DRAFT_219698 [Hypoxylon sp. CI-4A]
MDHKSDEEAPPPGKHRPSTRAARNRELPEIPGSINTKVTSDSNQAIANEKSTGLEFRTPSKKPSRTISSKMLKLKTMFGIDSTANSDEKSSSRENLDGRPKLSGFKGMIQGLTRPSSPVPRYTVHPGPSPIIGGSEASTIENRESSEWNTTGFASDGEKDKDQQSEKSKSVGKEEEAKHLEELQELIQKTPLIRPTDAERKKSYQNNSLEVAHNTPPLQQRDIEWAMAREQRQKQRELGQRRREEMMHNREGYATPVVGNLVSLYQERDAIESAPHTPSNRLRSASQPTQRRHGPSGITRQQTLKKMESNAVSANGYEVPAPLNVRKTSSIVSSQQEPKSTRVDQRGSPVFTSNEGLVVPKLRRIEPAMLSRREPEGAKKYAKNSEMPAPLNVRQQGRSISREEANTTNRPLPPIPSPQRESTEAKGDVRSSLYDGKEMAEVHRCLESFGKMHPNYVDDPDPRTPEDEASLYRKKVKGRMPYFTTNSNGRYRASVESRGRTSIASEEDARAVFRKGKDVKIRQTQEPGMKSGQATTEAGENPTEPHPRSAQQHIIAEVVSNMEVIDVRMTVIDKNAAEIRALFKKTRELMTGLAAIEAAEQME